MAIYNNREVQIISPVTYQPQLTQNVQVKDIQSGQVYNVKASEVWFSNDEKKSIRIVKNDDKDPLDGVVNTASDEDISNVRKGIAPSFDRDRVEIAKQQILNDQAQKASQEQNDKAQAQAQKEIEQAQKTDSTPETPRNPS